MAGMRRCPVRYAIAVFPFVAPVGRAQSSPAGRRCSGSIHSHTNIPLARGQQRLQLRWEIENIFDHTRSASVDSAARFDAQGNQVNARFGQVITTRAPRVMQAAVRVNFWQAFTWREERAA